jgi:hypothetical protein
MDIVPFSRTKTGTRLFFPDLIELCSIRVNGRKKGVRLLRIPNPHYYDLHRQGGYDGSKLEANCTLVVDDVQLEKMVPKYPNDTSQVHLLIGGEAATDYADQMSLFPEIRYTDCDDVSVYLGNCIASVFLDRCSINTVTALDLRGELLFRNCQFQPNVQKIKGDLYTLDTTLGTRFTNCTVHAPIVNGRANPELVNRTGFVEINRSVRYFHINTTLGNRIIEHYQRQGMELKPDFIAMLKLHHRMED